MAELEGFGAIVLGAAGRGNIGQAIARRLARDGARVLVAGRRQEPLEELASEIGGHFEIVDAASEADLARLVARAQSQYGRLDVAVNATGRNLTRPLLSTTPEELRDIAEIQFVAPFLFLQAMVRGMTAGGSIIHISSVSARNMMRDHAAYAGTKAGFEHVVRQFAWEFGPQGVRINCVSPGLTPSPMTAALFKGSDLPAFRAANTPLRRIGTPEDVAAAVAWLASPECFLTGETLQVNGGAALLAAPLPPPKT